MNLAYLMKPRCPKFCGHFKVEISTKLEIIFLDSIDDTVDGSEIRRSPVEVGNLSHYLQGFSAIHTVGFLAGFLNHQQYQLGPS